MDRHELRRFLSDHPGHPLGVGMPMGRTLRADGESHRDAWMQILRADPCAYCGHSVRGFGARTVDHIVPQDWATPPPAIGGKHSWLNFTAACEACNGRKAARPLLRFLQLRR